ncbi:type VI secretion system Vgr family protein [Polyangium sorediatum]|uniref:Type VI secretion system tip protein TssI/VgrG n=1 Tax=Polyangium sorediatum TaxID=889274 RepID=A0ABT6NLB3_9BACT|nr:type VI secretion system tip protein TssI/VgrG [Polyangium sorediatum]MDI1429099.1 type VI secretion system tip protein TssI/VgrG [Polyangium sorediatum]
MPLDAFAQLEIEGMEGPLRVVQLSGREAICAPASFDVVLDVFGGDTNTVSAAPESLITKPAKISWTLLDGGERVFEGLVDAVEARDRGYNVRIVQTLALLADTKDYRVFLDQDAVEITREVFSEAGVELDVRVSRSLDKRAQYVQAFESTLDFVRRILAEEGISFFAPFGSRDKVVLVDGPSGFEDAPVGPLPVRERAGLDTGESVYGARLRKKMVPQRVRLQDYDFENPGLDLTAETKVDGDALEVYEYPGQYRNPASGAALVKLRMEELRARRKVLTAATSCRALSPGHVVELEGPEGLQGRWLLLAVEHRAIDRAAEGNDRYEAFFEAVPIDAPFRPARTPAPRVGGIQTATVTGPGGAEIHPDKLARTKVLLRWDRRRAEDDTSSAWTRVVYPPTTGGFFLPRVGWETVVSFHASSADEPLVLGRLYNGVAQPPNGLPGEKVVTAFGSSTTPGGGSANVVSMNDTAGAEGLAFKASRDYNERTENDKVTVITADDTWTVGATRKVIVGEVHDVGVAGAQSSTVGGNRTVSVNANMSIQAASESVMVGAARIFDIGGDSTTSCATLTRMVGAAKAETAIEHAKRQTTGAATVMVGGSCNMLAGANYGVNVMGARSEMVAGAKTIKASKFAQEVKGALAETLASRKVTAGGDRVEDFAATARYSIGGSAKLQGSNVVVKATGQIKIKAGGATVTITPGSITIDGEFKGSVDAQDDGDENYE